MDETGKTRTITGYIRDLLEYPRWVIERDVDFSNCRFGGHYNTFMSDCRDCRFGSACRWLDRNRSPSLENAELSELTDALEGAVGYLRSTHRHATDCVCKTCRWLHDARHFRRVHLRSAGRQRQ